MYERPQTPVSPTPLDQLKKSDIQVAGYSSFIFKVSRPVAFFFEFTMSEFTLLNRCIPLEKRLRLVQVSSLNRRPSPHAG